MQEQRVIEAKIRMREKEMQDGEEKMQKRLESCSSSTSALTGEMEYVSASATSYNSPMEDAEAASSQNKSLERDKSCMECEEDCYDKQLHGWYGALQRQLQRSQYQMRYSKSVQATIWILLLAFLIVVVAVHRM
ncbi:unnamed protein product [Eruca vesicaria subsp. sativa]|uniref:Transmembrane protein n=1 Tax=Eruca vesicaria subsp. sativa TaxID=29727 RepID=A0ABC8J0J2_ERUVS|nr:unnamed protein product [Eruca vesicaria subsp. sativa]